MHFGILDLLTIIGSVGLFLYGMKLMSEGLQKAAGDKMRNILAMMTNNRFLGALTGIAVTALLQSSSATTVMIVSFVNAGLLSLGQSMAVIMGTNLGTSITAWIISLFGFKVNISAFSIPIIAFSIPLLFSKKNSWKNWGEFLLGFSLLFLGLDFLNKAVPDLQANPAIFAGLQRYATMGFSSVLLFFGFGLLLTMIVQASSATFAIVLIMCSKGWVPFEIATAVVLGSKVGTCITPMIASISGNVWAKRAAIGHLTYNILGSIWVLALYFPFVALIVWISKKLCGDPTGLTTLIEQTDSQTVIAINNGTFDTSIPENAALAAKFAKNQYYASFGLSMFHTIFNVINLTIMIWFTKLYVKIVTLVVPDKKKHSADEEENTASQLVYISTGLMSTAEISIIQAHKEICAYSKRSSKMFGVVRELFKEKDEARFVNLYGRIQNCESNADRIEIEIAAYLSKVSSGRLSDESKHLIQTKLRMISEIESVCDSFDKISHIIRRANEMEDKFTEEQTQNIELMYNLVQMALDNTHEILVKDHENITADDISRTQSIETEIDTLRDHLRHKNVVDLNNGLYSYPLGICYLDIIVECEKVGDYLVNIVEAVAQSKLYNFSTVEAHK